MQLGNEKKHTSDAQDRTYGPPEKWTPVPQGHISQEQRQRTATSEMAGNTEDTRDPLLDYMYDKTELAIQIGTNQVNWADLSMTVEPQSLAKAKSSVRAQDSSPAHLLTLCGYRNHKTETKKQLHSGCNSADNYFLKGESQASTLPQKT